MSNAMSVSKSRWKGALLATIAGAVVTPLAAHAQSMTVGLTLSPYGQTPAKSEYIDPIDPVTLYVYATVTGASAPSASYVDGLSYLYYNVNAAVTSGATGLGAVSAATLDTNFGGGSFGSDPAAPGAGAQIGNLSTGTITATPSIVLGDPSVMPNMAKPRNQNLGVFSTGTSSGNDVIVKGDSVSFLVETLTYTPNASAIASHESTAATPNTLSFNVSVPSLSSQYYPSNYYVGLGSVPTPGTSIGASSTLTAYNASGTSVTLTNAIPGDANLDGTVGFADLSEVLAHYGASDLKWGDGNFLYSTNTSNPAFATIGFGDLSLVLASYGSSLGAAPSLVVADPAVLDDPQAVSLLESFGITPVAAVPEPASIGAIGLLVVGGLSRRRRR